MALTAMRDGSDSRGQVELEERTQECDILKEMVHSARVAARGRAARRKGNSKVLASM